MVTIRVGLLLSAGALLIVLPVDSLVQSVAVAKRRAPPRRWVVASTATAEPGGEGEEGEDRSTGAAEVDDELAELLKRVQGQLQQTDVAFSATAIFGVLLECNCHIRGPTQVQLPREEAGTRTGESFT